MRPGPAISIAFHAAIVLWFILQTPRLLDAGAVPAMTVDLVPPSEAPPPPDPPKKPQEPWLFPSSAPAPAPQQQQAAEKPAAEKPPAPAPGASQSSPGASQSSQAPSEPAKAESQQPQANQNAATNQDAANQGAAAAQTQQPAPAQTAPPQPPAPPSADKIDAPPSNTSAKLTANEIATFKLQLQKCWDPPPTLTDPRARVVLRTSFTSQGRLVGQPALIAAPASNQGPALVASAMKAIQQCAPYSTLPAEKYKEWRTLDIPFTTRGVLG